MSKLLIVEDSFLIRKVIKHVAAERLNCEYDFAEDFAQARELIDKNDYFLALCDLHLPDAPNGEVIEYTLSKELSTIVLTGTLNEDLRSEMLEMGVLDYIYKENKDSYITAINLIGQLLRNQGIKVLVADDSKTLRSYVKSQLVKLLYHVVEADDGQSALEVLQQQPDIGLLITDYNMPNMNGIELIQAIRQTRSRENFPIIGLSSSSDLTLSARFIKHGANDFLVTPFIQEEFQWRILNAVEQVLMIAKIRDAANRDYLTELYNRRYFFSAANQAHRNATLEGSRLTIGLLDIDFFKNINDTFGHDVGDKVLIGLARKLEYWLGNMTVARYGGEEFIILIPHLEHTNVHKLLEAFRIDIQDHTFNPDDTPVRCTVSIGVSDILTPETSLEEMINCADIALYEAKKRGRNQVIWHNEREVE